MDNEIDSRFFKTLLRCYLLQKQVKTKVFHQKLFIEQAFKVFRWQRRIRNQVATNNGSLNPHNGTSPPQIVSTSNGIVPLQDGPDFDIVRRNLWLMIVRKEVIQAQKRRVTIREQGLIKSRHLAYRCQLHLRDFHRKNRSRKQHQLQQQNHDKTAKHSSTVMDMDIKTKSEIL